MNDKILEQIEPRNVVFIEDGADIKDIIGDEPARQEKKETEFKYVHEPKWCI